MILNQGRAFVLAQQPEDHHVAGCGCRHGNSHDVYHSASDDETGDNRQQAGQDAGHYAAPAVGADIHGLLGVGVWGERFPIESVMDVLPFEAAGQLPGEAMGPFVQTGKKKQPCQQDQGVLGQALDAGQKVFSTPDQNIQAEGQKDEGKYDHYAKQIGATKRDRAVDSGVLGGVGGFHAGILSWKKGLLPTKTQPRAMIRETGRRAVRCSGQLAPGGSFNGYWQARWKHDYVDFKRLNVTATEMEASVMMVLSKIWGLRAGGMAVNLAKMGSEAFYILTLADVMTGK